MITVDHLLTSIQDASTTHILQALCLAVMPTAGIGYLFGAHRERRKHLTLLEVLNRFSSVQKSIDEFMFVSTNSLKLPFSYMTESAERVRALGLGAATDMEALDAQLRDFAKKVQNATTDNQLSESRSTTPDKILFGKKPNPLTSVVIWAFTLVPVFLSTLMGYWLNSGIPTLPQIGIFVAGYIWMMVCFRRYGLARSRRDTSERQASQKVALFNIRRAFIADLLDTLEQSHTTLMGASQFMTGIPQGRGFFKGMQMLAKLNHSWRTIYRISDMGNEAPLFAVTPFLRKITQQNYTPYAKKYHQELLAAVDDGLAFHIRPRDFEKLMTILVDNAIVYSKPGARIVIRGKRRGHKIIISVTDTGPGIPNDIMRTLFQPDQSQSDTIRPEKISVELQICKVILCRIGGELKISSKLGKGTTATIIAPRKYTAIKLDIPTHIVRAAGPID